MYYAVAVNIGNIDTRFTRKSRGFLQVLFLPQKTLGSKILYRDMSYKLSLLRYLNVLDRLQSIRICHGHKTSIQLTFECCTISEFRGRIFKVCVQFNQWKVLSDVQGSTNRTRTIAFVPEIITLILLADIYICFQIVCVCVWVFVSFKCPTPEFKKYKMKHSNTVNSISQIGRHWSNVTPRSFWPMSPNRI